MLNYRNIRKVPYANCRRYTLKLVLIIHSNFSKFHFVLFIYQSVERFKIHEGCKTPCMCFIFYLVENIKYVFFSFITVTSRHILKEETIPYSLLKLQRGSIFRF